MRTYRRACALVGGQLNLMHPGTFEQVSLNPAILGHQHSLLKEGMDVTIGLLDGEPISGV